MSMQVIDNKNFGGDGKGERKNRKEKNLPRPQAKLGKMCPVDPTTDLDTMKLFSLQRRLSMEVESHPNQRSFKAPRYLNAQAIHEWVQFVVLPAHHRGD